VEVVGDPATFICKHVPGEAFRVEGEDLVFPDRPGEPRFSHYALAALLPFFAAKQRPTHPNDWMTTDAEIACPDPHCKARFRITRMGQRTFQHSETTAVPLPDPE
jgi:uncharacterized repeat protein (TIGR04076 family)